tara:strand:+ start:3426 stop:4382 length:957 start_codon:yes stop_codon:yes gene_type:complete
MTECFLKKYTPTSITNFSLEDTSLLNHNNLNLLINGNIGTGKTSLLIGLIHNYLKNDDNLFNNENILFMNNLKDQGIQYCRTNVKLFCQTANNDSKLKKIIAVDDIDEFSDVSQQVICNCISKYEKNVIFFGTCTNVLKIVEGLKTRMAMVTLTTPKHSELKDLCSRVVKNENIDLNKEYFDSIVESSNLSYKILLNILQKISIYSGNPDEITLRNLLTFVNYKEFDNFIEFSLNKDISQAINQMFLILESGISVIDILFEFVVYLKRSNKTLRDDQKYIIVNIISKYVIIFYEIHEDTIELAFFTNEIIDGLTSCDI